MPFFDPSSYSDYENTRGNYQEFFNILKYCDSNEWCVLSAIAYTHPWITFAIAIAIIAAIWAAKNMIISVVNASAKVYIELLHTCLQTLKVAVLHMTVQHVKVAAVFCGLCIFWANITLLYWHVIQSLLYICLAVILTVTGHHFAPDQICGVHKDVLAQRVFTNCTLLVHHTCGVVSRGVNFVTNVVTAEIQRRHRLQPQLAPQPQPSAPQPQPAAL